MALPTGKGDITDPLAWQDSQGHVPPTELNAVPYNTNYPQNGDGRYWWQGNAGTNVGNKTTLLLHGDGTNGSTTETDSSFYNNAVTAIAGAVLDTSTKQFGTASMAILPGSASYAANTTYPGTHTSFASPVVAGSGLDITVGGADFTIEGWFNISTLNAGVAMVVFDYGNDAYSDSHTGFYLQVTPTSYSLVSNVSGWNPISATGLTIAKGVFHHFAVVRHNTLVSVYIDGTLQGTPQNWTGAANPALISFGTSPAVSGSFGTGWIDEARITEAALYLANFTPPTSAFTVTTPNIITFIGDPTYYTGVMALTWQLTQLSTDGGLVSIAYSIDGGQTFTLVALPNGLQGLQSGKINVPISSATGTLQVTPIFTGTPLVGATKSIIAIDVTRNQDEGPVWDYPNPFNPINYNCDCLDNFGNAMATLSALRQRVLIRLGFSNQAANPPPGMAALVNEFLISSQTYLYRRYNTLRTRRFFRWKIVPGQRFYSLKDNDENVLCNFQMDPMKTIEWAGIQDTRNVWYPLIQGIPPQLYTMLDKPWRPARYDIRQCIEVYPAPDQTYWLWLRGNFGLMTFASDSDVTTLDSELVFLHALANAKAHYGQPDANNIEAQANAYRAELVAGTHQTAHYVPGTIAVPPAVRPTLIQFNGQQGS